MARLTFVFLLKRNIINHITTDLNYCAVCLTSDDDNNDDDGNEYNDVDADGGGADDTDKFLLAKAKDPVLYKVTWRVSLIFSWYLHQGREGISSRV